MHFCPNFVDINECADGPCGYNSNCLNTIGSYLCECQTGYEGNGTNCTGTALLSISPPLHMKIGSTAYLLGLYLNYMNDRYA